MCGGERGRAVGVGRGASWSFIHRDRDRQRQGVNVVPSQGIVVRVVEAMWRSVAILKPNYRKEKNFNDRAVFECLGGRL